MTWKHPLQKTSMGITILKNIQEIVVSDSVHAYVSHGLVSKALLWNCKNLFSTPSHSRFLSYAHHRRNVTDMEGCVKVNAKSRNGKGRSGERIHLLSHKYFLSLPEIFVHLLDRIEERKYKTHKQRNEKRCGRERD